MPGDEPQTNTPMELIKFFIEDIRRTKNQMWQTANYSVLVQVAIFTAFRYLKEILGVGWQRWSSWVFIIASIVIVCLSIRIMLSYRRDIKEYRLNKNKLWDDLKLNSYLIVQEQATSRRREKVIDGLFLTTLSSVMLLFVVFNILYILTSVYNPLTICSYAQ